MKKNKYKIFFLTVVTLVIVFWTLRALVAEPYRISGDCMEPAVMTGQLCFLNRILPYLRKYQINDIIAFKHEGKVWISRIVALETDTIQIIEGSVIVNGVALPNVEIHRDWSNWKQGLYAIDKPLQIPTGHVYVLSDKLSAQHDDSRVFAPIPMSSVLGIVLGCR